MKIEEDLILCLDLLDAPGIRQKLNRFINQDVKLRCPECGAEDTMPIMQFVKFFGRVENKCAEYNPLKNEQDVKAVRRGNRPLMRSDYVVATVYHCVCGAKMPFTKVVCDEQD